MKRLALAALFLSACGDDDDTTDDSAPTDDSESSADDSGDDCPQPSDAPTSDAISSGGTTLMCYNAPPEGYCWETSNTWTVEKAASHGKGAVGCTDGIAITDGTCPTDTAIGRCDNWGTEEDRVYYACNKFGDILPDGLDADCQSRGGTWTDL